MKLKTLKILGMKDEELLEMRPVRFYKKIITPAIKKAGGVEEFKETELFKAIKEDREMLKKLRQSIYEKYEGNVYGTEEYEEYRDSKKLLKLFTF